MAIQLLRKMPLVQPASIARHDEALELLTLRELEASGPLTGLEVVNRVASLAETLRVAPPGYPLLHALLDGGFLRGSAGLPRRYEITAAGRAEADRLAERCWPYVRSEILEMGREVARVGRRLAPGDAEARRDLGFVTAWADEALDAATDHPPPRRD